MPASMIFLGWLPVLIWEQLPPSLRRFYVPFSL
jgi:hypothetical protein